LPKEIDLGLGSFDDEKGFTTNILFLGFKDEKGISLPTQNYWVYP
jgi:hypothetical protein